MAQDRMSAYGVALLPVSLGIMNLAYSVLLKLLTFGLAGTAGYFETTGLPDRLAYDTFAVEAVGGVLLMLGIQPHWVALALPPPLVGAIIWVPGGNGWVRRTRRRMGISALPHRAVLRAVRSRRRRIRDQLFSSARCFHEDFQPECAELNCDWMLLSQPWKELDMKLYYATRTCSLSPHIVASEAGIPLVLGRGDIGKKPRVGETGVDFGLVKVDLTAFPRFRDFIERVGARPKVQETMRAEGLKVAS